MLADPAAAAVAVAEFVDLLRQHREARSALRSNRHTDASLREAYQSLDEEILQRLPQMSAIASSVNPGLINIIGGAIITDPFEWKYADIYQSALVLKGAVDSIEATRSIVGVSGPNPQLSTMDQRSAYAKALGRLGATKSGSAVTSELMALQLQVSMDVIYDIETFLIGADLIEYPRLGQVRLSEIGQQWVDQFDAALDSPPPNSRTVNVVISPGARVGAIQAGSDGSTQVTRVEVDAARATKDWINDVRSWLDRVAGDIDPTTAGQLIARIEDVEEQLRDETPDRSWIRRQLAKVQMLIEETGYSTVGSLAAEGIIAAAPHIASLW